MADEHDLDVRVEGRRRRAEGDFGVDDLFEEPVAQTRGGRVEGAARGVGRVDFGADAQVRQGVGEESGEVGREAGEGVLVALAMDVSVGLERGRERV